ncbi:MAG: methylglyoxal synthase [Caldisericales bacterium]|nr:methylglyoxal synthase [bacterium]NMD14143.1 methylglyoxal synthase [Caldisericales bacterium]
MEKTKVVLGKTKKIALVAHDNQKRALLDWAKLNKEKLSRHQLFGTGTTGRLVQKELGLEVHCFNSGPLGGDQQIGAKIVDGDIDLLIFFWDPLAAQPHDPDVKALLRIAVLKNIPTACNRSTADFIFSSILIDSEYEKVEPDYSSELRKK